MLMVNIMQNITHIRMKIATIGFGSWVLINHNTGEIIKAITTRQTILIRNSDMVSIKILLILLILVFMLSHFLKLSIVDSSSI